MKHALLMSDPHRYQRIKELFHAVCDLPLQERLAHLNRHCADDPELRAEVLSLLGVEDSGARAALETPIGREGELREIGEEAAASDESGPFLDQVGPYRIVGTLGTGGMGVVYKAEQQSPARTVALKLIRAGLAGSHLSRRFRHEAEVLGRLQHPGIAQIYEAGIAPTPLGPQPFFAMELIEGCSVIEFAARQRLDVRRRLGLFAEICDAVQHAHERGVIHRDLKPANILVELSGRPKILDFGVARLTDSDHQYATLQTTEGQIVGTLPYMSPEQIAGRANEIDTRTDVYSLGVTMFELLAGRLPCDVSRKSLAQAARVIAETEPVPLGTIDRAFRGDIETLVGKALEKDKSQRYASASELAADIRRYLDNLPLMARPASTIYQLRKFASRNRALVAFALVCLVLLIAGIVGTTSGLISAQRANRDLELSVKDARLQRDRARESEVRAQTELSRSRQVTKFMQTMLKSANPSIARGRDATLLKEILSTAEKKLDAGELADQPAVEADMRATICDTYNGIGDNESAMRVIEPAMRLARAAPADQAGQFQRARISYASMLVVWGRLVEAKAEFEQALALQESGMPEDDTSATLYSNYAGIQARTGDIQRALELNRRALAIRKKVFGENHFNVAASMANIAGSLQDLKEYDESLSMLKDALAIYRNAEPPRWLHITILETNMAGVLLAMERLDEAETTARDALKIGETIYQPNHQQMGLAGYTLGLILQAQGRHDEAREQFARCVDIFTNAFSATHAMVVNSQLELGRELVHLKRFDEAEVALLRAHQTLSTDNADEGATVETCKELLVELYESWHSMDANADHLRSRDKWKSLLSRPTSAPTKTPSY